MIIVDLSGFTSNVRVGTFPVWQFQSGIKPSANISLGCIGTISGQNYGKQAVWTTAGDVTLTGGVVTGDLPQMLYARSAGSGRHHVCLITGRRPISLARLACQSTCSCPHGGYANACVRE